MNIDTLHHFSDGLYAKQMSIPKGAIACQHKHEYDHLSVLAQGKVRVLFDDEQFEVYEALLASTSKKASTILSWL